MKSKILKIILFLLAAAFVGAVFITVITVFCNLVLVPRGGDLAATVRGFGLLLMVLGEDSLSARFWRNTDLPGFLRWIFDAVIIAAGLALAFVLMTYTPLHGLLM